MGKELRLMKGNEAFAEAAIRAGAMGILVTLSPLSRRLWNI